MSFNGESGMAKRQRTDLESTPPQRDNTDNYNKNYDLRRKKPESEPNCVLLFTIINPVYPITVDVLFTICTPSAPVLRIVIFKKNGVQAMVEFESIEAAKRVKDALNGADIYSGCCTLKIEYAKPTKLNVYKNDMESWDYTNPCIDKAGPEPGHPRQAPLLQDPRFGAAPTPYNDHYHEGPSRGRRRRFSEMMTGPGGGSYMDYDDGGYHQNGPTAYGDHYVGERFPPGPVDRFMMKGVSGGREGLIAPPPPPRGPTPGGAYGPQALAPANGVQGGTGCVMMAYGLDPSKANPDKLFNLFCLYGNVIRIKFLKTKEGCAMIQMGDSISVERCIHHLKNAPLFGSTLQLGFSKQTFLSEVAQPYTLPDNSPSFKDFSANKNNRFLNATMASKNRIQGPAKILHFFNTPPEVTEEQLMSAIEEKQVKKPNIIKLFPKKGERSSSGLMEFEEIADAINALVYCNHLPIKNPDSKFPYVMKLCFSSSRSITVNGNTMFKDE